jgi:hypothetical protein
MLRIRSDQQKQQWQALTNYIVDGGFSNLELCELYEAVRLAAFDKFWPGLSPDRRRRVLSQFGRNMGAAR